MDAWEGNYAVDVKNFAAFDFAIFCVVICVGKKLADRGDAGATVSIMDGFIGIEAVLARPPGPDAHHGGRGVDQDSIHVKQERFAGNFRHWI